GVIQRLATNTRIIGIGSNEQIITSRTGHDINTRSKRVSLGDDVVVDIRDGSSHTFGIAGNALNDSLQNAQIVRALLIFNRVVIGNFDFVQQSLFGIGPFGTRSSQEQLYGIDDDAGAGFAGGQFADDQIVSGVFL